MSPKLRNILIIVGVGVVLLLIAPFLIPVNQFKPTIEAKASEALGRRVEMGNLSFSLLGASLSAEGLSVGDDPKFSQTPFLTAKKIEVGVEVMPLIFSRTLNITSVSIKNPQVTLLHDDSGQWNYSSIGGAAAKTSSGASRSASPDVSVKKLSLEDGVITVGYVKNPKRNSYDHVTLVASDISLKTKFPLTVSADLPGGGKFKVDGTAGPMDQLDAALTPIAAKITASSLDLAATGFLEPGTGLGGSLDLDASIASASGTAETKGTAKLSKALFVQGGAASTVPLVVDFDTKYELGKESGVLNPSTVKIGSAAAHLSGTYGSKAEVTSINIKVDGQGMPAKDLEAFLPAMGIHLPTGASLQGGTLNTNLTLAGPTTGLVTSGNVGIFNAQLAGFDLGSKLAGLGPLMGIKTGNNLDIEKVTTDLRMNREGLKADNFVAVLPALGTLTGAGTLDSKNELDFKMVAALKSGLASVASPVSMAGGMLGQLTGGGAGGGCKDGGLKVPFQIKGTTANPQFVPDVGGAAAGMLKSQLGCAGGAASGLASGAKNQTADPAKALGGLGGLFKKPKP
jgi:AsmA protein